MCVPIRSLHDVRNLRVPLRLHPECLVLLHRVLPVHLRGVLQRQRLLPLLHPHGRELWWVLLSADHTRRGGVSAPFVRRRSPALLGGIRLASLPVGFAAGIAFHSPISASPGQGETQAALVVVVAIAVGWAGAASP